MPSPDEGGKLSFERDIKPLFRAKDRDSMMAAFDLFDYADVIEHADAIVGSWRTPSRRSGPSRPSGPGRALDRQRSRAGGWSGARSHGSSRYGNHERKEP